jgi:PAS domain S-box-containing protein
MESRTILKSLIDWRSIRGRTIAFTAATSLPLLCLCTWLAVQLTEANTRILERARDDLARQASFRIDQEVNHSFGMLASLTASRGLIGGRIERFRDHAQLLLDLPSVQAVWVFSSADSVVASVGLPPPTTKFGAELQRLYREVFRGDRAVSQVVGNGIANSTVVIAMPVIGGKEPKLGLAAELRVEALSNVFRDAGMPADWPAAVVDRSGHYVARSLDAERRVGQQARPKLVEAAQNPEPKGIFENVTYEGVSVMNAYHRSNLTGWTTVVAIPSEKLDAPFYHNVLVLFFGGGIGLAAMLAAAFIMSKRISEPVRNLAAYAHSVAVGGAPPLPRHRILELEEVQKAFARSIHEAAHLAAVVASSADAILSTDINGRIRSWNKSAENLFKISAEEAIGQHKTIIVPDDKRSEFELHRAQVLGGENVSAETVRTASDGNRIEVSLTLAPIRQPDGRIVAISSIIRDVRERRAIERHIQLLMHEIAHRSKNQLAVVQAIATQTARSSSDLVEFLADFRDRLRGMAVATDLLIAQNWTRASLRDLIENQLELFAPTNADAQLCGPEVMLDAKATEAVGLAIHELATNAVKHGAWSKPSGRVKVDWRIEGTTSAPALFLSWCEFGANTEALQGKGFGTLILEKMVPTMLGGQAKIEFGEPGLCWSLTVPIPESWSAPRPARAGALQSSGSAANREATD